MKKWTELSVAVTASAATTALAYPAETGTARATLVLAHGAGAGQRHPFMVAFAQAFARLGLNAVTFNFLYTEHRRRIPDRPPVLEACYLSVIDAVRTRFGSADGALFIGGKSMGGRIATQIAAADPNLPVDGLVLLGYPLHPPGRPEQRRDAHLPQVRPPMLFVQGSRDAFGTPDELRPVVDGLRNGSLHVVEGGDHSFKISQKPAAAQAAVQDDVQRTVVEWIGSVMSTRARARRPRA